MSDSASPPESKKYIGKDIDVTFEVRRCMHVGDCTYLLRAVFDKTRHPWVQPDAAGADEVAATVLRCPAGALHFTRKDGGTPEAAPARNTVTVIPDGPLYLHGDLVLQTLEGEVLLEDTRMALCRCGASQNKPFCDNSHNAIWFEDDSHFNPPEPSGPETAETRLKIIPKPNGSLRLEGPFDLISEDRQSRLHDTKAALCRCGASQNKPFCDRSHRSIEFEG